MTRTIALILAAAIAAPAAFAGTLDPARYTPEQIADYQLSLERDEHARAHAIRQNPGADVVGRAAAQPVINAPLSTLDTDRFAPEVIAAYEAARADDDNARATAIRANPGLVRSEAGTAVLGAPAFVQTNTPSFPYIDTND